MLVGLVSMLSFDFQVYSLQCATLVYHLLRQLSEILSIFSSLTINTKPFILKLIIYFPAKMKTNLLLQSHEFFIL